MAPPVDSSSSSGSSSGSESTSSSQSEQSVHDSPIYEQGRNSPGSEEHSTCSTGRKAQDMQGSPVREPTNDAPARSNGSEASERISIMDSIDATPAPVSTSCTFFLGRSKVTHMEIQNFVNKGYLRPDSATSFRSPGDEIVPRPKWYEAVVFRDFFFCRWSRFSSRGVCERSS